MGDWRAPQIQTNDCEVALLTKEEVREVVNSELAPLKEQVARLNHHITGNGTPERGVLIRMDRLEQDAEARKWFTRATLGTVIGAFIASMFALFR